MGQYACEAVKAVGRCCFPALYCFNHQLCNRYVLVLITNCATGMSDALLGIVTRVLPLTST